MVTYGYLKQNPDGHSSCLVVPIIGIPAKGFKKQPKFNSLCFIQAEYSFLTISDVKNSIIVNRIRHCSIQFTAELKQEFICRLSSRLESSFNICSSHILGLFVSEQSIGFQLAF